MTARLFRNGSVTVLINTMIGINNTGYYNQYYKTITKLVFFFYFHFSYLYLFLAGNINVYTTSQGTNRENYYIHFQIKVRNADFGGN